MAEYKDFMPNNIAPKEAVRIVAYNKYTTEKVGTISLRTLRFPTDEEKQYSFMAVSDSHITGATNDDGTTDLNRAVAFAKSEGANFICHCGDVTNGGSQYEYEKYKGLKDGYGIDIYAITGNHDCYTTLQEYNTPTQYLGNPLYYSFEYNDDVFIMLGEHGWTNGVPFADGELQWFYNTLEANRNKRCFVFQHIFNFDEGDSGQPTTSFYSFDLFGEISDGRTAERKKQKQVFISLLKHYKNTVWFHGHTHARFELQAVGENSTYSEKIGYKSVHIPSAAKPKNIVDGAVVTEETGSQGYMVDVYSNGVHLRGRDFVREEFLPIASYWLDTTLQTIAAKAFTDSTGTITT